MKILAAIAHHGTKNRPYLDRLLASYRAMRHDVDLVVLSDTAKPDLGEDVEVRVGAPTSNPWSLPFAHRQLFAERADAYDLYIYSEDDTLLTEAHLDAFCETAQVLADDEVPGFMRYEEHPDGRRSYCSVHSSYHWDPRSVHRVGGHLFASFTNQHSACYVLTRQHLRRALASGGFLVPPHEGLYDMLVSAATDPYVGCGLRRLLCITRIDDFLVHHLPDVYLGQLGISQQEWQAQLEALYGIADGTLPRGQLIAAETRMGTAAWNRQYYPRSDDDFYSLLSRPARHVLSVGCGDGALERQLYRDADRIVGIPLDEVIAAVARTRGIETTPSELDAALDSLIGAVFDVVLAHDLLGRVRDPAGVVTRLAPLVKHDGELIATAPNHPYHRLRRLTHRPNAPPVPPLGAFDATGVHRTSARVLTKWLTNGGFQVRQRAIIHTPRTQGIGARLPGFGRTAVAAAQPTQSPSAALTAPLRRSVRA